MHIAIHVRCISINYLLNSYLWYLAASLKKFRGVFSVFFMEGVGGVGSRGFKPQISIDLELKPK